MVTGYQGLTNLKDLYCPKITLEYDFLNEEVEHEPFLKTDISIESKRYEIF